ncbi:hypothetical protein [Leptospira alstonii]|uniref:Uncharacterized protein n=2 Tax=Leptospira alstonii TaxID=28452 RepID=M6D105_9LEPT|nr:hypothetical protein [Leptospira alstonii]EMJ96366.1 hypothetical protein LEP1GSC194_3259 [Leptospira alstonii serovar Sichuan str. 79601]EQA81682.1 hypothetical protein LEP1GSC193_2905 [Leptospira alstonii serovar Pingchang str. 80-412]
MAEIEANLYASIKVDDNEEFGKFFASEPQAIQESADAHDNASLVEMAHPNAEQLVKFFLTRDQARVRG